MDNDWQKEITNIKKLRKNKVFFSKAPKKIYIENIVRDRLSCQKLPDINLTDRKTLIKGFVPTAKIDLHGLSKENAFSTLSEFIDKNYYRNIRDLLIITGKGSRYGKTGVLKSNFNSWLNERSLRYKISVFTKASPKYGGEGAFFVKLKNVSRETF